MLTRNGWTTAALCAATLTVGLVAGYVELVAVGAMLLVALGTAVAWLFLRPSIEVSRSVGPTHVAEGEGASAVLSVTNSGVRRTPPLLARERMADRTVRIELGRLAPDSTSRTSYALPTDRRGVFEVGPLELSHGDALGLVTVIYGQGAVARLVVHPRTVRVAPLPTGRAQDLDGPTAASAPRGGIAFHSLREYVPGDDLRLVHWPTTARMGTLMVRHTVVTNEPRLVLVLDTSSEPYPDAAYFEDAVRVTASLLVAAAELRYPIELFTTGGASASVDATGRGRTAALDLLAAVRTEPSDAGLRALTGLATQRQHGASLGVVSGMARPTQLAVVTAIRSRYEMATLVQVGEHHGRTRGGIDGVLGVACRDLGEFARVWKAAVG